MMRTSVSPRRFGLLVVVSLLGMLVLGACMASTGGVVTIKTLLDDPTRYDGKKVRVTGDVGKAMGVFGYGAYQLNDGTGTLNVVTKTGGAPREGAKVGVVGMFKAVFTLGSTTAAGLQETKRFTP